MKSTGRRCLWCYASITRRRETIYFLFYLLRLLRTTFLNYVRLLNLCGPWVQAGCFILRLLYQTFLSQGIDCLSIKYNHPTSLIMYRIEAIGTVAKKEAELDEPMVTTLAKAMTNATAKALTSTPTPTPTVLL